ncbi:hypothetical protein NAV33_07270 [Pseudomonas stutzeri]|uniref:hypothetical protein n=1 Tax=Stutzerimonas stutzeri TaxID=316 RepID=UPI002109E1DD|nr:hypothetical protein [Stutzerimonas stutzeri]MCQ4311694.1 hypothetical protein [Stutzerimonas stutzeri]
MAKLLIHKVVSSLPAELEADSVYFVRVGAGFEIYVTNGSGTIVPYPSNYISLDSPAFTGNPTAPTADADANDMSIANMAAVRAAMALFGLGTTGVLPTSSASANDLKTSGWVWLNTGATDKPLGSSSGILFTQPAPNLNTLNQLFFDSQNKQLSWRQQNTATGEWEDWDSFWHSGNLTPTGVTAPGPWQYPTLLNGWINYGVAAGFTYRSARFRKHNDGLVVVEGLIKGGGIGSVAFTLPSSFRPSQRLICAGYSNGTVSRIDITPEGEVIAYAGSNVYFPIHFAFAAG